VGILSPKPLASWAGEPANEVTICTDGACVVVTAVGDFDAWSLNALRSGLAHGARSAPRMRLDASAVTFVDAATLGVLVATRRIAQANACAFEIVAPSPQVRRVLAVTGLSHLLGPPDGAPTPGPGAPAARVPD
jgi:anti-sigma B factor antagonist